MTLLKPKIWDCKSSKTSMFFVLQGTVHTSRCFLLTTNSQCVKSCFLWVKLFQLLTALVGFHWLAFRFDNSWLQLSFASAIIQEVQIPFFQATFKGNLYLSGGNLKAFTFSCHDKSAQLKSINILKRKICKSSCIWCLDSESIQLSVDTVKRSVPSKLIYRTAGVLDQPTSMNVTWHSMPILCTWLFFFTLHFYSCILLPQNDCCSISSIVPQQACYHTHDTDSWLLKCDSYSSC